MVKFIKLIYTRSYAELLYLTPIPIISFLSKPICWQFSFLPGYWR